MTEKEALPKLSLLASAVYQLAFDSHQNSVLDTVRPTCQVGVFLVGAGLTSVSAVSFADVAGLAASSGAQSSVLASDGPSADAVSCPVSSPPLSG